MEPHELPDLRHGSDRVLETGMVVAIEPGIYVPGVGGVRHSDTYIVIDLGYGIQPPVPAWGSMLAEGKDYMAKAWWLTRAAGQCVGSRAGRRRPPTRRTTRCYRFGAGEAAGDDALPAVFVSVQ